MYSLLHSSPPAIGIGLDGTLLSTILADCAVQLSRSDTYLEIAQLTNTSLPDLPSDLYSVSTGLVPMGSIGFFQHWFRRFFNATGVDEIHSVIGMSVKVTQTIPIHGLGRVHCRGTEWAARTIAGKTHKPGDGVTIRRVEGIILIVE